jgi:hypothetical protein
VSWVQNGPAWALPTALGAILAAYVLILFTPIMLESLRPSYRRATRRAGQPGAIVKCGCPGATAHPLFGPRDYPTRNGLETDSIIATLRARGCRRILVITPDGAQTVVMPQGPIIEHRR